MIYLLEENTVSLKIGEKMVLLVSGERMKQRWVEA